MKIKSTTVYNFCLRLSEESESAITEILAPFSLDTRNKIKHINPHVTAIICPLNIDTKKEIFDAVTAFVSENKTIRIKLGELVELVEAGSSYISYPIISDAVYKFADKIVEIVSSYNHGNYNHKYDLPKYELNTRQLELLHTYGYHRVKELFKPHLSVITIIFRSDVTADSKFLF